MPELPEVEITKNKLKPHLLGKRILDLGNKKILRLERRGKAIILYLSHGYVLAFHQRMSGKLLIGDRNYKDKHIRFRFKISSGKDLIFHDVRKFGIKWYGPEKKIFGKKYFKKLGADPLSVDFKKFYELLGSHKGMIKALLLRQDILSGIGNIIADETLWHAGLHPRKKVENFSKEDFHRLYRSLQYILKRSISLGGSTMRDWMHPDGSVGEYFKKRFVYQRKGEKCSNCATIILRTKVAGRGTFVCEKCQK